MFENCNTLAELNAERRELIENGNICEINQAYNIRRKEILESKNQFHRLEKVLIRTPEIKQPTTFLAGPAKKKGCITCNEFGVFC